MAESSHREASGKSRGRQFRGSHWGHGGIGGASRLREPESLPTPDSLTVSTESVEKYN